MTVKLTSSVFTKRGTFSFIVLLVVCGLNANMYGDRIEYFLVSYFLVTVLVSSGPQDTLVLCFRQLLF